MNTQCPYCETVFSVEEDLVQALDARARCGMCRSVFNARDQLLEEPPTSEDLSASEGQSGIMGDDTVLDFDEVLDEPKPSTSAAPELILKTTRKPTPEAPPEFEFEPALEEDDDEPESGADSNSQNDVDDLSTFSPSIEFNPDDVEEISLSSDGLMEFEDDTDAESERNDDQLYASPDGQDEITDPLFEVEQQGDENGDAYKHNEAFELLGASAEPPPASKRRTGLWLLGSLALLFAIGGQWVYANRGLLINKPELRPVVNQVCAFVECQIEPLRDVESIELLRRSVYSHPNIDDALIISLALVNNADFAQPFPVLRIRMADVRGQIVAQRDFEPHAYLDAAAAEGNMAPGAPLTVTLEIHDPGNDALTFELEFL